MAYGYLTPASPATGFTVEAWTRRSQVPPAGAWEGLFIQHTQANPTWSTTVSLNGRQLWFGCSPSTGALFLSVYDESGTSVVSWTDPSPSGYPDDNEWHHIALRYFRAAPWFSVFLDGQLLANITPSSPIHTGAGTWKPGILTVGGGYSPHTGFHGGYLWREGLAMVAVTNKPLSDNRIQEHYAAGNGGTVYYGDDEVERMTRIFDWTDTPVVCRDPDPALSTLQGVEVAGTNALDALLDTAKAAGGYVYADGQSWLVYHNRRHRYNRFSVFTFAESLGSGIEAGVDFITDEEKIWNDVRGRRPYGGAYRMKDNVSIDEYGRRTYEFELPITSAEELRNTVGWLLSRYGVEHLRVAGVTVRAESSAILEAATTGRLDVGDHLVLDELPDWAPVRRMELSVEGLSLEADFVEKTWAMTFNLTPGEFDRVFQVGVSTLGGTDKVAL